MSKPLELTIHPPLSPIVRSGVDHNLNQDLDPYFGFNTEMHVPGIIQMRHKRLTEPELAAESYRQMVRAIAGVGIVMLHNGEIAPADVTRDISKLSEDTQRLGIIKRFAAHPHYFEPTESETTE